ncbi:MAG: hypothetical protein NZ693_04265, partial [Thermoflexales bacterium]|nr:hypothetical protein [Thermoflexales bacterium]
TARTACRSRSSYQQQRHEQLPQASEASRFDKFRKRVIVVKPIYLVTQRMSDKGRNLETPGGDVYRSADR